LKINDSNNNTSEEVENDFDDKEKMPLINKTVEYLKKNENKSVELLVLRRKNSSIATNNNVNYNNFPFEIVKVIIIPKKWDGMGLLGFFFAHLILSLTY
jgi:hypothetical protein